ncbi:histone-like nucleoid-structuring protein Lsr2 [Luteococcus sp. Sow4_B9]|uniref:histone-like nucleoid-structuring protein Lsr2 n=1 Tax=Luteococcus sp. Sow4_B9 TaxID=3438792 RepID=UPI003F973473
MAQRVHIVLEDDVDGSEAVETVSFALDGVSYEIDLSEENASKLRDQMAMWTGHARRVGGRRSAGKKPKGSAANDIRAWALERGMQVSARGRVPAEIREAYEKANS